MRDSPKTSMLTMDDVGAATRHAAAMADARDSEPVVEVVVRFARTIDPICGRMSARGDEQEFEGWLGLVTALEQVLEPGESTH